MSLAWMMDQLASLGVGFEEATIERIFKSNMDFYLHPPPSNEGFLDSIFARKPWAQWAIKPVYVAHRPIRPWALGKIYENVTGFYILTGKRIRTPGLYHRVDPDTGRPTDVPLQDTNERVHRSVRVRLDLEGLSYGDVGLYESEALLGQNWRLAKSSIRVPDPIIPQAVWSDNRLQRPEYYPDDRKGERWIWEYVGPASVGPSRSVMVEEPLGPYERQLLRMNKGNTHPTFGHPEAEPSTSTGPEAVTAVSA